MDISTIVLSISTALGGGGSAFLWLETRTERARKKRVSEIEVQIAPLSADVQSIHDKLDASAEHTAAVISLAIKEAMIPVSNQLSVLNTKVEPLWTALINMGINQVNVLHQPDPRRAEVDALLEKLQEELRGGRLMTAEEFLRMRHFLMLIKEWEPGQDIGFPVLPAEPTSAAILLAIMGLSRARRVHNQEEQK